MDYSVSSAILAREAARGRALLASDVDALAELTCQLLDRKDEYRVLGKQGAAIIQEKYSIDVCLPKMVELYETVKHR